MTRSKIKTGALTSRAMRYYAVRRLLCSRKWWRLPLFECFLFVCLDCLSEILFHDIGNFSHYHRVQPRRARVFICSRTAQELAATAKEIGAAGYFAADVSQPQEVMRVVVEAVTAFGGLDCLVTNAGGPPTAPFEKAGDSDWDIAFDLNLMSAVRLIREALPALKASGRGRIVNLTGYGVKEPMTDLVVSDSLRAGVTVMAKTIASDLAPYGITVNNIAPAPIMTDRLGEILSERAKRSGLTLDERLKRFAQTIPVRRMGQPGKIGDLCAYLCSPRAGYLTGQTIVVDGGINRSI